MPVVSYTPWRVTPRRAYELTVLEDGPCFYWRLNETSGTVAVEEIEGENGTYINNPNLLQTSMVVEPTIGGSTDFARLNPDTAPTGNDQRIPTTAFLNPTGDFTIECWFKTWVPNSGRYEIMSNRPTAPETSGPGIQVGFFSNAWRDTLIENDSGQFVNFSSKPWVENTCRDHHMAMTWDDSTGTAELWIDGKLEGTSTNAAMIGDAAAGNLNSPNPLTIGSVSASPATFFWEGVVDEVAFYCNGKLSEERIVAHYNAGVPVPKLGPYELLVKEDNALTLWAFSDFGNPITGLVSEVGSPIEEEHYISGVINNPGSPEGRFITGLPPLHQGSNGFSLRIEDPGDQGVYVAAILGAEHVYGSGGDHPLTLPWTLEFWINAELPRVPTGSPPTENTDDPIFTTGANNSTFYGVFVELTSSGSLRCSFGQGTFPTNRRSPFLSPSGTIQNNTTHHVVIIWKDANGSGDDIPSSDNVELYVDGELVLLVDDGGNGSAMSIVNGDIGIGVQWGVINPATSGTRFATGVTFDTLAIYKFALPLEKILDHYNLGSTGSI